MSNKVIIGIDQSYKDTAIAICVNSKLKAVKSIKFENCKTNSEKRCETICALYNILSMLDKKGYDTEKELKVLIERIRLQSAGFVNINYIKSIGALNAVIVDRCNESFNTSVYSVDTRAWKKQVVGTSIPYKTSKYGLDVKKEPTIDWCINKGYEKHILEPVSNRTKKGIVKTENNIKYTYNDNMADAIAISHYGFIHETKQNLQLEY